MRPANANLVLQGLSAINIEWLNSIRRKLGRKPTILHIGNIANNAYNNARLLNQSGFDCDVICYDYYHVMACPEWEDANFQASFKNDNRPDWWRVDLGGFERPQWFAQGTFDTCTQYLIAKRTDSVAASGLWDQLSVQNGSVAQGESSISKLAWWISIVIGLRSRLSRFFVAVTFNQPHVAVQVLTNALTVRIPKWCLLPTLAVLLVPLTLARAVVRLLPSQRRDKSDPFQSRIIQLLRSWREEFPDRVDRLEKADLLSYSSVIDTWRRLLSSYDFVIGYSTDPFLPMLAGVPFYALEHGTIRDIPYSQTPIGRLCALSYRRAQHVFVTNFDCVESAQKLAPNRFTVINHPYDEDHGLAIQDAEDSRFQLLRDLDSSFLIFHPTRHDWVEGSGYADKSNDVLIRAFIKLRRAGLKVGLICCSWGKNVADTQALLAEAGLTQYVKWVATLPVIPFERMCRSCDVVADQFKLGAFGGVCFKAMAVGAPILTYLNEPMLLQQYSEVPPVLNCQFDEDIVSRLSELMRNPEDIVRLGEASRAWMKLYHGKAATINAQIDQFRKNMPVVS
jgi:glycosyltransferase involved in cell wall biosynthesis